MVPTSSRRETTGLGRERSRGCLSSRSRGRAADAELSFPQPQTVVSPLWGRPEAQLRLQAQSTPSECLWRGLRRSFTFFSSPIPALTAAGTTNAVAPCSARLSSVRTSRAGQIRLVLHEGGAGTAPRPQPLLRGSGIRCRLGFGSGGCNAPRCRGRDGRSGGGRERARNSFLFPTKSLLNSASWMLAVILKGGGSVVE